MPAGTVSPIDPCLDQLTRWTDAVSGPERVPELLAVLDARLPDPRGLRGRSPIVGPRRSRVAIV